MEIEKVIESFNGTQSMISFGKNGCRGFFNYEDSGNFLYRPYLMGWTDDKSQTEIRNAYRRWR